jgi:hypothetical protein
MAGYSPTPQTLVFMAVFVVLYLGLMLRNTVRRSLDLYDFLLLSSVAIVPASFVFFPALATRIATIVGVEFPLVVVFGTLFLITFVYLYRLVVKANGQGRALTALVQEAGLMRREIEELNRLLATARREEAAPDRGAEERREHPAAARG